MAIDVKSLTTGEVTGSGLFDELMRTSKDHILSEYDAGRLTGSSYAEVYLGMLQANLQASVQFTLQADINSKQLELMQEQVLQSQKQIELMTAQLIKTEKENLILDEQLLVAKEKVVQEGEATKLITAQKDGQLAQTELVNQQKAKLIADTALVGKQEDLVDKQILTETANTSEPTGGLTKVSYDKGIAEEALLVQKKQTEKAQTEDPATYIDTEPKAERGGGIAGAQIALYKLQKEGFKRDAEQKFAKIYSDSWAVTRNIEGAGDNAPYGLDAPEVNSALAVMRNGMGLP